MMTAMLEKIKSWLGEDINGRINMAINIMILLAIMTTCSRVVDVDERTQQIQSQTQAQIQPVVDEDILKGRIIEFMIQTLEQAQNNHNN
jgi:hypothetical protein